MNNKLQKAVKKQPQEPFQDELRLVLSGAADRRMTVAERAELAKLVRARTKVMKRAIIARAAEQLADMEHQLSALYRFDDRAWKDVTDAAAEAIRAADAEVAKRCRARGIPEAFRPSIHLRWDERGETRIKDRRDELRRLGKAKIEADKQVEEAHLERIEADLLTEIVANGLTSENAKAFLLGKLWTVEAAMPQLNLAKLEKEAGPIPEEPLEIDTDYSTDHNWRRQRGE